MTSMDNKPGDAAELRQRVEAVARQKAAQSPEDLRDLTPEEGRRLLHELRVHQIELEMQNEELRRAQVELDTARARYFDLYDLAPVGYLTVSEQGLILEANLTAATLLGVTRGAGKHLIFSRSILKEGQDIYFQHRKQLFETGERRAWEMRMVKKDGTAFPAHLEATVAQDTDGAPVCRIVMSDITELLKTQEALQKTLSEVRTLHGLLPICAWCKRIRDDEGYWKKLEAYISEHSQAEFSHGICPECVEQLREEYKLGTVVDGENAP